MSLQKTRPLDTLQRIMSSFKHFERKLDKLQEDVNYHGRTLSDLRVMLANLSSGTMLTDDTQKELKKRHVNNTAIQYDDGFHFEGLAKTKKNKVQPFLSKMITKSLDNQKYGINTSKEAPYRMNKLASSPKNTGKKIVRHRKAEAPRKTSILRAQKATGKKH